MMNEWKGFIRKILKQLKDLQLLTVAFWFYG